MIYSTIARLGRDLESYPKVIKKALRFLRDTNFDNLQDGRYEIQGEQCFVILGKMETKPLEETRPEAHDRFLDIQALLAGKETIGFAQRKAATPEEDLLKDKDICFYSSDLEGESLLHMEAGEYAIFFPADIHRPLIQRDGVEMVRKAVVKISMDLLDEK